MTQAQGRLLLIMSSATYRAAAYLAAAEKLGVPVTVATERPQALAPFNPAAYLTLDFDDLATSAASILEFAVRHPLTALLAAEDDGVVLAAQAGEALGLPHVDPRAARATRNKLLLRERLAQSGVPSPSYELRSRSEDPRTFDPSTGFPCVLKPLGLSGSQGVIRADDRSQFVEAFRRIGSLLARPEVAARAGEGSDGILIESYVPGLEVAVEGLMEKGALRVLAVFDKPDPLEGPYFEETIYVTPSRLSDGTCDALIRTAIETAAALGLNHGPIHLEARLFEDKWYPVDVAARSIGGVCSKALRFAGGVGLEELILRHALGQDISSFERESQASGVMMIPIPRAGIFREVAENQAASVPGIEEVQLAIPRGQKVEPLPEGSRYLGFLFARADSPEEVESALREAHRRLEISIEPA